MDQLISIIYRLALSDMNYMPNTMSTFKNVSKETCSDVDDPKSNIQYQLDILIIMSALSDIPHVTAYVYLLLFSNLSTLTLLTYFLEQASSAE